MGCCSSDTKTDNIYLNFLTDLISKSKIKDFSYFQVKTKCESSGRNIKDLLLEEDPDVIYPVSYQIFPYNMKELGLADEQSNFLAFMIPFYQDLNKSFVITDICINSRYKLELGTFKTFIDMIFTETLLNVNNRISEHLIKRKNATVLSYAIDDHFFKDFLQLNSLFRCSYIEFLDHMEREMYNSAIKVKGLQGVETPNDELEYLSIDIEILNAFNENNFWVWDARLLRVYFYEKFCNADSKID